MMNPTLLKSLLALVPLGMLFAGSLIRFIREKAAFTFLQLLGAGGLVIVLFAHFCEATHLLPWMKWGSEHSVGHYLDLTSAVVGLTLFPVGYLFHSLTSVANPTKAEKVQGQTP